MFESNRLTARSKDIEPSPVFSVRIIKEENLNEKSY